MSYYISLCDPLTHEILETEEPHFIRGGTYAMNGTKELWLIITYNYAQIYYRPDFFGNNGIRSIYGLTGAESIPVLQKAIEVLHDNERKKLLFGLCDSLPNCRRAEDNLKMLNSNEYNR